jgi:hypothetical protein
MLNIVDRTEDAMLWHDHDADGKVNSECKEDKALTRKMERVKLRHKGRQNQICFVY